MSTGTTTAGKAKNTTAAAGKSGKNTVKVRILEKEVQMSCASEDEDNLKRAARHVDQSMSEFRQRNFSASVEKIAIVTAINMANELLRASASSGNNEELGKKIASMQLMIEEVLEDTASKTTTTRTQPITNSEDSDSTEQSRTSLI